MTSEKFCNLTDIVIAWFLIKENVSRWNVTRCFRLMFVHALQGLWKIKIFQNHNKSSSKCLMLLTTFEALRKEMELWILFASRMFWWSCQWDLGNRCWFNFINPWTLCWTTQCSHYWCTRWAWNSILNAYFHHLKLLLSLTDKILFNVLNSNFGLLWHVQMHWIFQSVGSWPDRQTVVLDIEKCQDSFKGFLFLSILWFKAVISTITHNINIK